MKKKIFAVLLIFCAFILCGCSSGVQYSMYQKTDGSVSEVTYIPFSCSELRLAGVNEGIILQMQTKIIEQVYGYYANQKVGFVNRVNADPDLTADDKEYIKAQYNKGVNDIYVQVGVMGDSLIPVAEVVKDTNFIKISLTYESVVCYYMAKLNMTYAQMINYVSKDDSIIVQGFGVNKKLNSSTCIFNLQYDETRNLATYILDECKGILKSYTSLTNEQIETIIPSEFVYRYGTTSKRMRSNADQILTAEGIYFHEWTFSTDKDANGKSEVETKRVQTWTNHANKNVWYVITLGVAILIVGEMLIFDHFRKKKNDVEVIEQTGDGEN